jgi:hypothetical protein
VNVEGRLLGDLKSALRIAFARRQREQCGRGGGRGGGQDGGQDEVDLEAAFDELDTDGSGDIDAEELRAGMVRPATSDSWVALLCSVRARRV